MGNLSDTLKSIDGASEIFFCGYDGIVIEKFSVLKSANDGELFAANCATAFNKMKIEDNRFKEMICVFEKNVVVAKWMEDGFIGVIMGLDGNIGRAKLELNRYGSVFYK